MTAENGSDRRVHAGLNWNSAEKARWQEAARRAGKPFSVWARELLDREALGKVGGVAPPPADPEFNAEIELVRQRSGQPDKSAAMRWAVVTLAAMFRKRLDVLLLAYGETIAEIPISLDGATESKAKPPGPRRGR